MNVKQLPRDPGPAGWNRLLPDPEPALRLEGVHSADWLVIGAGFAGLSAARRLSQLCPGDRISILEATRVGEGPAGRNSGFMVDLPHNLTSENYAGGLSSDRTTIEDNRRAIDFAADMAEQFEVSAEAFSRSGKINASASARGDAQNQAYAKHLAQLDEPFEHLDATQMRALTGSRYYSSGLLSPGAAIIQPAMYVRSVASGLVREGVTIYENSPVLKLHKKGSHWFAHTPLGHVSSPKVILAVNGHVNSFGFLRGRLCHIFTYASMTCAMTDDQITRLGGEALWGVTPADPLGTSVRRISGTGGDRIVIRNQFTFDPAMEVSDARVASAGRRHDKAFRARFPMLRDLAMEFRWGGRLCMSLNNVQAIREWEDGLFVACVQNGIGTVRGTLAGLLAAELAVGQTSDALYRALDHDKPKRLPPEPFVKLGASLRIKFGEWRAGSDL